MLFLLRKILTDIYSYHQILVGSQSFLWGAECVAINTIPFLTFLNLILINFSQVEDSKK